MPTLKSLTNLNFTAQDYGWNCWIWTKTMLSFFPSKRLIHICLGLLGLKLTKISLCTSMTVKWNWVIFKKFRGAKRPHIIWTNSYNNRHCVYERFSFLTRVLSSQNIIICWFIFKHLLWLAFLPFFFHTIKCAIILF